MPATHSPDGWAYRHRRQHNAAARGKALPLDPRTSKRFSAEFENALKARGAEAKVLAEKELAHPISATMEDAREAA